MSTTSKGTQFEELVAEVFRKLGYTNVYVTPHSNDGGIDIIMYEITPSGEAIKCGVECKDIKSVGREIIQKFHSAMITLEYDGFKRGYVVTSGTFTSGAINKTDEINALHKDLNICLISGEKLVELTNIIGHTKDIGFTDNEYDNKYYNIEACDINCSYNQNINKNSSLLKFIVVVGAIAYFGGNTIINTIGIVQSGKYMPVVSTILILALLLHKKH